MKWRFLNRNTTLWLLLFAFAIVVFILWNTNEFFVKFKEEERLKMEIWATAQSELRRSNLEQDLGDLPIEVMRKNTSTPMILQNKDGSIRSHNLPEKIAKDSLRLIQKMKAYAVQNTPLELSYKGEYLATLYYGNSEVLTQLRYYPIALLLIVFLFGAVLYFFFMSNKMSEQNRLWTGMAKETAHQIGTPLTSLVGWAELLKNEDISPEIPTEINKDIERLQVITDRFSKIGSVPKLEHCDLVEETRKTWAYLEKRNSKLVRFHWHCEPSELFLPLNPSLYSWSIENLVKNGIDAMKGKGDIFLDIKLNSTMAHISIRDTGSGIPKDMVKRIFHPGVTTKERGWGLGLSLVRRIVEEYHGGRIRVLRTGESGTTMQISLPLYKNK